MVYKWRKSTKTSLDPQVIGEHLEDLREKRGLTPAVVVEDARQLNSPTHEFFEWDDEVAAHAHRLYQARELIAGLVVEIEEAPDTEPLRAFVSIKMDEGREYTSLQAAMSDRELREQVVEEALRELELWKRKYNGFHELAQIFEAIEAMRLVTS